MNCVVAKNQKEIVDNFVVRSNVFCKEQDVPWDLEFDGLDTHTVLFNVYKDDKCVGAGRFRIYNDYQGKAERIAVLKEYRSNGVGRVIMDCLENYARDNTNLKEIILGSQLSAKDFYIRLGYEPYGDIFLDAGIDHVMMKKSLY